MYHYSTYKPSVSSVSIVIYASPLTKHHLRKCSASVSTEVTKQQWPRFLVTVLRSRRTRFYTPLHYPFPPVSISYDLRAETSFQVFPCLLQRAFQLFGYGSHARPPLPLRHLHPPHMSEVNYSSSDSLIISIEYEAFFCDYMSDFFFFGTHKFWVLLMRFEACNVFNFV